MVAPKFLAASLAALSLALTFSPAMADDNVDVSAATSTPDEAQSWGDFGIQTRYIDRSVKPGDDFNAFVNGKWLQSFQIPADQSRYGSFTMLDDLSDARLHALMDELVASQPAVGTPEGKIAASYSAFMNTAAIDAAGMSPAKPYLDRIAAAKSVTDLMALFADSAFSSPIGAGVGIDAKASDRYAFQISQGGLGLPDRDYYLVDSPRNVEIRARYMDYLAFMLGKAGHSDPRAAAQSVYDLEHKMAAAMWDRALSRNRDITYNKLPVAELAAMAPSAPLDAFMRAYGAGSVDTVIVRQIPPTAEELAAAKYTPEMAAKLGGGVPATLRLIGETPVATWQAWLAAHFVGDHASVLPSDVDAARFAFYGKTLSGQPEQQARWKRGIAAAEGQVGELVGQRYAEKYFPEANRAAMTDLVANLRKAMAANLADLKWMSPATRVAAKAKLDAFTPKIGAPEVYKTYDGLALAADNPLGNSIASAKWAKDYELARLGGPVDRKEWGMLPETVNAYYNSTMNEIVFPAAILQPPFFNLAADPAVNYGAIGAVIGHEMGHGFDDQGAKSDGAGNLRDWWTPADKSAFEALTGKLAAQYDALCPFDAGKTCINGRLTLGENIGDLGGLSLAYRAYKMSLNGKKAPVIDGYTGDQRFFMGYAQVWRSRIREEEARKRLATDPHSPADYRINGIVRNFDEWYKAFNVKPGDKMYLPPEQRLRIW
ncbi:M13 family metallopeptidase [Novosphingobium tardum]|uniref:M13 family metallopeptidase n=1 Tax=Novosphingobium tardum TaxID=1538021 RepID=A0ABV8RLX0_9SPHN